MIQIKNNHQNVFYHKKDTQVNLCPLCWYVPIITALGMLRQEDKIIKTSLDYIARTCLEIKKIIEKVNSQSSINSSS